MSSTSLKFWWDKIRGWHLVMVMRFPGMLVGLFGEFVGGQMIRFVVSGTSIVSVFRKVVEFS
jgi:hypothetical protein